MDGTSAFELPMHDLLSAAYHQQVMVSSINIIVSRNRSMGLFFNNYNNI